MRYLFIMLLATACGYGIFFINDLDPNNYVKIYIFNYVLEVSIVGFLVLMGLLCFVICLVIWLFRVLWKTPASFKIWRNRRQNKSADAALGAGYLALIKGDWKQAEKSLTTKSDRSSVPYINYLAAAQAAQEQGKLEQRDDYLSAAYKAAPKERLAIGLTKARLHQSAGQLDQALATLQDIAPLGTKNAQFTAMLMQTYEQLDHWDEAAKLLPAARKQKALPADVLDRIYFDIYTSTLRNSDDKEAAWRALPRDQKLEVDNVALYATYLLDAGDDVAAEKLLRSTLKSTWSDELVRLYGSLPSLKPAKLRRAVEGWLMARPESAELNLAAGRFALLQKDQEAAQDYLQKAIAFGQLPLAYSLLGELLEASNDSGKALQLYRAGMLALSDAQKPDLNALDNDGQVATDDDDSSVVSGDLLVATKPVTS